MTREEAISVLEESKRQNEIMRDNPNTFFKVSDIVTGEKNAQKRIDALNMAISALRQQEHFREVTKKVEPLTLDELRQMDGEPVYCVEITGREEWLFRRDGGFADMYGEFTSDDFMVWDNYGKLWWCYRQKPDEDDHDERKEN